MKECEWMFCTDLRSKEALLQSFKTFEFGSSFNWFLLSNLIFNWSELMNLYGIFNVWSGLVNCPGSLTKNERTECHPLLLCAPCFVARSWNPRLPECKFTIAGILCGCNLKPDDLNSSRQNRQKCSIGQKTPGYIFFHIMNFWTENEFGL